MSLSIYVNLLIVSRQNCDKNKYTLAVKNIFLILILINIEAFSDWFK